MFDQLKYCALIVLFAVSGQIIAADITVNSKLSMAK